MEVQAHQSEIDIDQLPMLDTVVGMKGMMTQVEVGGQSCLETGIIIAVYS